MNDHRVKLLELRDKLAQTASYWRIKIKPCKDPDNPTIDELESQTEKIEKVFKNPSMWQVMRWQIQGLLPLSADCESYIPFHTPPKSQPAGPDWGLSAAIMALKYLWGDEKK